MRLKTIYNSFIIVVLVIGLLGFVSVSFAGSIFGPPELPAFDFDSEGSTTYIADTDILSVQSTPQTIEFPIPTFFNDKEIFLGRFAQRGSMEYLGSLSINVEVDEDGVLVGGIGGEDDPDFIMEGELTLALLDNGLVFETIPRQIMLKGEVIAEGFDWRIKDGIPEFAFRFRPTGGYLIDQGLFSQEKFINVQVQSEHSTFEGDISFLDTFLGRTDEAGNPNSLPGFEGEAKGASGSTTQPSIDECLLDHFMGYKFKSTKSCQGGVTELTIEYNGLDVADIDVIAEDKIVLDDDAVNPGDFFSVYNGGQKLGKEIDIYVNGGLATTIHTSCSQPIYPTQEFGAFKIVSGESLEGGDLLESTQKFETREVFLADELEEGFFEVKKPYALYNPAEKNGGEIFDPDRHLVGYKIKRVEGEPKHVKRYFRIEDQFGTLFVDTKKPDRLLVPSLKNHDNSIPNVPDDLLDHFKCYKVKVTKGTEKLPKGIQVTVVDQFDQSKLYDVKKPNRLCIPVDKNGEGIKNEDAYLMFYKVKLAKDEPKHISMLGIHTNNQFGPLTFDTSKEEELGVPSCEVEVVEPPPGLFTCKDVKPIDELTMIWNGTQEIHIKAWKGPVDSTLLGEINNITPADEVIVSGYAGSDNDVIWEIFADAGKTQKIGESTFHLSCSDVNMNGPEDCDEPQGDGKDKVGYINNWRFGGMAGNDLQLDCP